jgi:hypothetical protein
VINRREAIKDEYIQARASSLVGDQAGADKFRSGATAFIALSTQLMDELPRFLASATKFFDAVVFRLAMIQSKWFEKSGAVLARFLEEHCSLLEVDGNGNGDVVKAWWLSQRPMSEMLEGLVCVSSST